MSKLPTPPEVLGQNVIILGKTRSGKSTIMRDFWEWQNRNQRVFQTLLDRKGDWWGLKYAADGKRPGFPVVIFGGEHADVPITPKAGVAVAHYCLTTTVPCIVDVSEFSVGEFVTFVCGFLPAYWKGSKGKERWLYVDEVHNYAPKGHIPDPHVGRMIHWMNKFAAEGLGRGIHLMAASQRTQKVHNDLLSSCECLVACKLLHPADRIAVQDWLKSTGDKERTAGIMHSLEALERAEGWVWSPEAKFGPERVQFPMYTSYDSFKPQGDRDDVPALIFNPKHVDLDQVREQFEKLVHEHETDNPAVLKAQIADLKAQLAKAAKTSPPPAEVSPAVFQASIDQGYRDGIATGLRSASDIAGELFNGLTTALDQEITDRMRHMADSLGDLVQDTRGNLVTRLGSALATAPRSQPLKPGPMKLMGTQTGKVSRLGDPLTTGGRGDISLGPADPKPEGGEVEYDLGSYERGILEALTWFEIRGLARSTRDQVGIYMSRSPNSGAFRKACAKMVAEEVIYYPNEGYISRTDKGRQLCRERGLHMETFGSNFDAFKHQVSTWSDGEFRADMLTLLLKGPMSRVEVAQTFGRSPNSGHIRRIWAELMKFGAIHYPSDGVLALTDLVLR